jgi:hypothetical protein
MALGWLSCRQIAEYQFEQGYNEREAAVCLIRATQDRSLNAVVFVEPVDSGERRPPRRTPGGVPRPQLTTALRRVYKPARLGEVIQPGTLESELNQRRLRKERRDEHHQQAIEDEFKRFPFLFPSRTMRPRVVLTVSLCSNGVENGVAKEQAETRIFIG